MPPQKLFDISNVDTSNVIITKEEIYQTNPHRHEFALLDGFYHLDKEAEEMAAFVDMKEDDFWVRGHIPGRPLFPGVLMIESAAQMVGYFMKQITDYEGFVGFGAVTDVKFRGQVTVGDQLLILGKIIENRGRRRVVGITQGYVGDTMAFEATVTGVGL